MTKGLYIEYSSPFVSGEKYLGTIYEITGYSHQIDSIGGFVSAQITKNMQLNNAEDWYEWGLGRIIRVFDHRGILVWKGFVNQVSIAVGPTTEIRGPLMNVRNRVSATYTPRDFTVFPPVDGSQTTTIINEDTSSQALYGILEEIISVGSATETTAELARDRYLAENSIPKTTGSLSITPGSASSPTVTLDLLGNVNWLMHYIYENTSATTTSYLSDKIIDILTDDVNGIISTDYNYIESNLYLVPDLETKSRMAWDIITELVSLGDGVTDGRSIIGVYDDMDRVYYNSIPTDIEYEYKLSNPRQVITEPGSSNIILPWMVRPGKWITVPDFLIGRNIPSTNLNGDPRNKFIDSVRFTAPYTVDLSGGANDTLSQMLKKISFSGGIY